jgi:hypothetical protein
MKPQKLTPVHIFFALGFYFAVSSCALLYGQNLSKYRENRLKTVDSTLKTLDNSGNLAVLSLVPSVNYSFQTGVSVGFSLGNFTQYFIQKKRAKIELKRLENDLKASVSSDIIRAKEQNEKLQNLRFKARNDLKILALEYELIEISYLEFVNNELTFSEFQRIKISYLQKYNSFLSQIAALDYSLSIFYNEFKIKPFDTILLLKTAKKYEFTSKN